MPCVRRRRRYAFAFAAVLCITTVSAPAFARTIAKPLTAADVVARAKAVEPAPQKAQIEDWSVSAEGFLGTQTVVRRAHDFGAILRTGPFTTEHGRFGGTAWHQDENGITVIERDHPERVTSRTLERASDGAYVVLETLAGGVVRRSYYDPRTFALVRRERWFGGRFSYTTWDDFHSEPGGKVFAWHYQGDDGDGNPFDYRLRSVREANASDDAELSVPRSRRELIEFPNAQHAVRLPARFDRKRILVRVGIGRHSYDFLLDTGASGIVLASDVAHQLGLGVRGSGNATGAGQVSAGRTIVPAMEVGGLRLRDVVTHTVPLAEEERSEHVAGLLGFDFIAQIVLRIDYEHGTLDAYDPTGFQTPAGANVVDVRLPGQVPLAAVKVGKASGDDFLVDTGAATTLLLFSTFAHSHPADVADNGVGAALAGSRIGVAANGIGGRIATHPVEVKGFRFGGTTFTSPLVYVADSQRMLGTEPADGLVGADVLSRFVVYLDYVQSRLLLQPPAAAR